MALNVFGVTFQSRLLEEVDEELLSLEFKEWVQKEFEVSHFDYSTLIRDRIFYNEYGELRF